ncbi:CbiX/SirB N-terminal domain-containing protein [Tropicibacter naphthalenivorans]|uniref:Cobalamin biosynthesis protein CbiX n=1 Tax=Tropicibacter naphthalenivorans TaxID=441103 RepID=A0A0P1GAT2_9RHOB|nr:CbiX/SirB N-terminal domain-containing protein [Tropicibacter naphthalenivorans]CUH78583.1 hypothetical protein TRN7648_02050 [Tropicibacter naphthalenivorans]SMC80974.1 Sirohydrochlorin ferrochelatase [Tropicibacter naphthalenivorans]
MPQPPRVIIVSHGQPSDPDVGEAEIIALAQATAQHLPAAEVRGATLAAKGALETALDGCDAPLIYPFFMSDGWFTKSALPKRLTGTNARQLPPFGLDPDLPAFTTHWLTSVLQTENWRPEDTSLFIAAHGSGRSPRPAEVTQTFAGHLAELRPWGDIRCGFVEQEPFLEQAATRLPSQSICLPFFALKRGHVLEDLPEALTKTNFQGRLLDPFGLHPDLPAFLAKSLARDLP